MSGRRCAGCRHYDPDPELPVGNCRRHAPTIDMVPVMSEPREEREEEEGDGFTALSVTVMSEQIGVTKNAVWPLVAPDDWCGEYDQR